jgi:phenylalanine-4-hydroxylase
MPNAMPARNRIPTYLHSHIVEQDYSKYTMIDQATWRFIMRISKDFFKNHAHQKYLEGLEKTGITTERIPKIEEMNELLSKIGWGAVAVRGFIPPTAFMEFQSLGILPICADMRTHEHIAYTPAPDIVHEAAGHAPIIADPDYAEYLKHYGEVAKNAIITAKDIRQYNAIRALSDIKEDPKTTSQEIKKAEFELEEATNDINEPSEAALLARMNWWTVEYGLVGENEDPKIYGAGLLSSVGESFDCLKEGIQKVPFSIECINQGYDITEPQPQLFVTPDFETLRNALDEFSEKMAYKRGGTQSLLKAKEAEFVSTSVLDSKLQISGLLSEFFTNADNEATFLRFTGPVQLCFEDKEISNHGIDFHSAGFSSPIGKVKTINGSPCSEHISSLNFTSGDNVEIEWESGIRLNGKYINSVQFEGKTLIHSFENCSIKFNDEILFDPSWGQFDLACGNKVISVFGRPADQSTYKRSDLPKSQTQEAKYNLTKENEPLDALYGELRNLRTKLKSKDIDHDKLLNSLFELNSKLINQYPEDWLLSLEILELASLVNSRELPWIKEIEKSLLSRCEKNVQMGDLIKRGMNLLGNHEN